MQGRSREGGRNVSRDSKSADVHARPSMRYVVATVNADHQIIPLNQSSLKAFVLHVWLINSQESLKKKFPFRSSCIRAINRSPYLAFFVTN